MSQVDSILDNVKTSGRSIKQIINVIIAIIMFVFIVYFIFNMVGRNGSGIYVVRQNFITGNLSTRFNPGIYWKLMAITTSYKAATSYKYSDKPDDRKVATAKPIIVRFNDGGRAKVYGDVRFVLPSSDEDMNQIHTIFGSQDNLMKECYSQITKEAVVMTAALMSSEESYASKRSQFSDWVRDQIQNGIYLTEGRYVTESITEKGKKKDLKYIVEIKRDSSGHPMRKEKVVSTFRIRVTQCVINDIVYLDGLDDLIAKKRDYLTAIIAANSAAEKAEQEMKTAEATGRKNVEEARYKTLESAEKLVTQVANEKKMALIQANKRLEVAKQNYYAAVDEKEKWISQGKGEAEKRRLVMKADGAIVKKKDYYLKAWNAYQTALVRRRLVPTISTQEAMNSQDGLPQGISILNAIDLQLQRELGIDLRFRGIK